MTNDSLKKFISSAPSSPGIYMFKEGGKKIYIGKAANLKARLCSYLKTADPRILKMLSAADNIEFCVTDSDIEALILESQLIKNLQPRFNIMLRDDKQYFFVGFTKDDMPRIYITHQRTGGSKYMGPFTDGAVLKSTLKFLRKIFPYCTCKNSHNNFCLNYHIGKCFGFCCLKIPVVSSKQQVVRDYKRNVRAVKDILSGKKECLIKQFEKEMSQAAKNGNLEKAIELRNKISKLKRVFENARIIHNTKYLIRDTESVTKSQNALKELARLLKLSRVPNRIEGYDISNIQGAHATGSMVTFVSGRPDKNYYRKFKIFRKKTADDTTMLREILERRFKHDEWPFPDLILIDGGRGQVNAAVKMTKEMNVKTPVVGVSKDNRHMGHQLVIPGRKNALPLNKLSPQDRNLVLAIDAEAHRFAISYYRKLHRRRSISY